MKWRDLKDRSLSRIEEAHGEHWLGRARVEPEPEFEERLDALSRAALTPWPPEKDAT